MEPNKTKQTMAAILEFAFYGNSFDVIVEIYNQWVKNLMSSVGFLMSVVINLPVNMELLPNSLGHRTTILSSSPFLE